jgi:hypothetical protein
MSFSDQWSLATGEEDHRLLIYRIRLGAPEFASPGSCDHLVVVSWRFQSPNEKGLPASEDLERMTEFEDRLQAVFEDARQGFLSVIVTGNGLREWQWYVRDPKSTMELVNKILGGLEPFPVQFSFQDDSEWTVYRRFLAVTGAVDCGL